MTKGASLAAAALLAASAPCIGVDLYPTLGGVKELFLVIEDLDVDAARCGITRSGIETSARFILQQSKIRVVERAVEKPYLYFTVIAVSKPEGCIFTTHAELKVAGELRTSYSPKGVGGVVGIWGTELLSISPPGQTSIDKAVEGITKQFVAEWSKYNQ